MYLKDKESNTMLLPYLKRINNIPYYHLKCYLGLIIIVHKLSPLPPSLNFLKSTLPPLPHSGLRKATESFAFSRHDSNKYGRVKQKLRIEDKKGQREETCK